MLNGSLELMNTLIIEVFQSAQQIGICQNKNVVHVWHERGEVLV